MSHEESLHRVRTGVVAKTLMKTSAEAQLEREGLDVADAALMERTDEKQWRKQNRAWSKVKHIEIQLLWLQEAVHSGKLIVEKILPETNSSDLGTKHLTSERSETLLRLVN